MENFLIIGPAWVGDMIMSQSLYRLIKNTHPDARITVLSPGYTAPLLQAMPEVDEIISVDLPRKKFNFFKRMALGKSLRDKKFTHAIILPNSFKSALIPFFAKIPKRVGFVGEFRYGFLTHACRLDPKKWPRMIDRFCALFKSCNPCFDLEKLPYPHLQLNKKLDKKLDKNWQEEVLNKWNFDLKAPTLAICPGAEFGPAKQWPAKYFAELALKKMKEGWQVWIFGSKKDEVIGREIAGILDSNSSRNYLNFIGSTSLEEAMALLSYASMVVSNDSGLMHIASALGRPVIGIYGSTSPDFTPPLSESAKVMSLNLPCQPCFQRVCPLKGEKYMACLNQLTPEKIEQAFD